MKQQFLMLLIALSIISCSKDTISGPVIEEEGSEEPVPVEPDNTAVKDCDFDLSTIKENETVLIDCNLNLEGKTINLPKGVTLQFEKGEIKNGTLNFTESGKIDGQLLNSSIIIDGKAQLISNEFEFIPSKWGIVEGKTNQKTALNNKNNIQHAIDIVKKLNGNTFKIDKLNAFFEVGNHENLSVFRSVEHAIKIPSDFNLVMSKENTFLKVFPNNSPNYALIAVFDAKNITIDGGNLIGDRDDHIYVGNSPHEHGHCLQIRSGVNIIVKNSHFSYGSGDGIDINSIGFTFEPGYKPSNNINIFSNTFDTNRRNNISITDGNNITIEDNLLLNAGINTGKSKGIDPGFGIDLESVRDRNSNGELVFFQRSEDIFIRNNIERGSRVGAITAAISYDVVIEDNITENAIGYSFGNGITIKNNKITAKDNNGDGKSGIFAGKIGGDATVYNNIVSNNEINGYSVGITVFNRDTKITDNIINDFKTGLFLKDLKNVTFTNNILNSKQSESKGIFVNLTSLNNVSFSKNKINVTGNAFNLSSVNNMANQSAYEFIIEENEFSSNSSILINKTTGLFLSNNIINTNIQLFNSNNISFSSNKITSLNNHGVFLRQTNKNIQINNNNIYVNQENYDCIKIQDSTDEKEISKQNNSCKKKKS